MKLKLHISALLFLILSACGGAPEPLTSLSDSNTGIVGGKETTRDNVIAKYVVLIYDTPTQTYCTGLLISNSVILTAAHCVEKSTTALTLAFGFQPLKGNYILRKSSKTISHPQYNKTSSNSRYDLALISIADSAPKGYQPLLIPDDKFPIQVGQTFTAAGYGRTSGKKDDTHDNQGTGFLRHVELKIQSLSTDGNQFYVDQKSNKGICSGDSGGPALMRYLGKDYVVGVASAISWTVPDELSGPEKQLYIDQKDVCAEKSIYMNVKAFSPWIQKVSRQLSDDLSKTTTQNFRTIK